MPLYVNTFTQTSVRLTHITVGIRSLGRPQKGQAHGITMARVSVLAIVQERHSIAMLREVSKLVTADLKLGLVLASVVGCRSLHDSELRVVSGKVGIDVPHKLHFLIAFKT